MHQLTTEMHHTYCADLGYLQHVTKQISSMTFRDNNSCQHKIKIFHAVWRRIISLFLWSCIKTRFNSGILATIWFGNFHPVVPKIL